MGTINRNALRDFRRLHGWSLADLAERVGTSKGYLSRIETGESSPEPKFILRLSGSLGVDVASITHPQQNCPNCAVKAAA